MAATVVDVDDLGAPELAPYDSVRDRDLARGRGEADGLFVAEGEVVVRVLASARQRRYLVRSLLLERRRVEALSDVLAALPDGTPAYVASQSVMDAIVGFSIHRGVLALGERGDALDASAIFAMAERGAGVLPTAASAGAARSPIVVALAGVTNHDNVGSVFRNAAAFGAAGVLLDPATCDPLYRKAIRVSVGGALIVPFARVGSAEELVARAGSAGWEVLGLSARGAETLKQASRTEGGRPRIVLLGAEGDGLPAEILARVRTVRVDITDALDSLNVAATSGIALYALTQG